MDLMNKELYENVISLLIKGLEIYADERKYEAPIGVPTQMDLDKGTNARFTLNNVNQILSTIKNIDNDFNSIIKGAESENVDNSELIRKLTDLANTNIGNGELSKD